MHYYQFNIADYRKDTTHLSMLEHGAYRQLLDWHYLDQSPIPLETEVVFRRLSARTEDEQKAILIVLKELFVCTENGYIQHRVMREIEQYEAKANRARDNGKLGGRPPKTKVVISDNQEETQEKANSITNKPINSLTNIKKNTKKNNVVVLENQKQNDFEIFWQRYPKKVGKQAAISAWKKFKPRIDDVMFALSWQIESDQWTKQGGQFIPNPATYINQGRWQDQPIQQGVPF